MAVNQSAIRQATELQTMTSEQQGRIQELELVLKASNARHQQLETIIGNLSIQGCGERKEGKKEEDS